ncbi:unnamed protein product [Lota lota]
MMFQRTRGCLIMQLIVAVSDIRREAAVIGETAVGDQGDDHPQLELALAPIAESAIPTAGLIELACALAC